MLSLVYVSSANRPFSGKELVALLEQSREKIAQLGITGMRLYKDGDFMQVLEGPDEAVETLFQTIVADERHREVLRLLDTYPVERRFPDWAVAFRNLGDPYVLDEEGYSQFLNDPLDSEVCLSDSSRAPRLLALFHRSMIR